jgi:hypothetical protein
MTLSILVFSTIGGYVPTLFGADMLSYSSLIGSTVGAVVGIYFGYKVSF